MKLEGSKIVVGAALAVLAVATLAAGVLMTEKPSETHAASGPQYTVASTAAGGVYSRRTPHTADTPRIPGVGVYPGDLVTLECGVTDGDPVGPYNNHAWYFVHDNSRNEVDFWLNDHYVNSPNAANRLAPGVTTCANESSNPVQQNSAPQHDVPNAEYNQLAAVEWALNNAEDPQDHPEECAWFVSQALWAGGLPQSAQWNSQGSYKSGIPRSTYYGSQTANVAPELIQYLEQHFSTQWIPLGHMNAGNNNVPQAKPGDIIAYSWKGPDPKTGKYTIDHLAFVVGDAVKNPQYPMVAEWGQFNWNFLHWPKNHWDNPSSGYKERGWTYSELNHRYLQLEKGNQNMTAYLLHFNGGSLLSDY